MRKLLCFTLSLLLCLTLAQPGLAQEPETGREIHIHSVRDFLNLSERCRMDSYSQELTVYLEEDLDLTEEDFQGIPIFCGALEGQHHKITGLSVTAGGSDLGLIRYLTEGASVRDLAVQGEITPEGSQQNIGGIVGINSGALENCSFQGTIVGKDRIGGIAGINGLTGTLDRCTASGTIRAEHRIGGIAGENLGVIRDCGNLSNVNITPQDNTVKITAITMDTLTGTEDPHTVTDVGGIAGWSTGVIRSCTNRGNIGYVHMGYNIGGIAGCHSGLIADSCNYGEIRARKEAGGIVGQFLPAAKIEYEKDTLQILEEQLNGTTAALNQAAYNTQHNMGVIGDGLGMLQSDAETALDALELLKPGQGLPDQDRLTAAKNALEQSISSLDTTMAYLQEATSGTAGQISKDLQRVSSRVSAMSQTIRKADETTGATLEDVSDRDTPEDLTGKVVTCVNYGSVSADINAGGICGAISFESEEDPEDELIVEGKRSLNAKGQLRAVILDCENRGSVDGKKIQVGGIAGKITLGLIKNCWNTGAVSGAKAQYAGGIAGSSQGYLRSCHVKCQITGSGYAGGIAGSAVLATDCQSMVLIDGAMERSGAILGYLEPKDLEEPALARNFYMSLRQDPGAVDGVSYEGLAEPLAPSRFLGQEDLPKAFRSASLRFQYEDGTTRELTIPVGSRLQTQQIPRLPPKDGYTASWAGLQDMQAQDIYFDAVLTPEYTPHRVTIRSQEQRRTGRPVLLAEGRFPEIEHIDMTKLPLPELPKGRALEAWTIPPLSQKEAAVLHYTLPENTDPDHLQLYLRDGSGQWREQDYTVNASCLVFSSQPEDTGFCVSILRSYDTLLHYTWIALAAAALILILVLRKHFKKKASRQKKA